MSEAIARNRKAHHEYEILERYEAGVALTGTEIKSCRQNGLSLAEAYARVREGEVWLVGAHIAEYKQANRNNHEPRRDRKLLLHRREIRKLAEAAEVRGLTLVPLRAYLVRGRLKLEIAVARGKNIHDKRDSMKRKVHEQEARRAMNLDP